MSNATRRYLVREIAILWYAVHAGIDWSHDPIPLDQELQEVVRDAEIGKHRVDKLFQVRRHDGSEDWIVVHVEVQSHPDHRLSQRLYRYYCRIRDGYDRRVVTLALLADTSPRFRPEPYEEKTLGCRVRFEYPSCKLLDLDRARLEQENNPAAVVILAHRTAQERSRDPVQREASKWALTRPLYERGYCKEDIQELFRVILSVWFRRHRCAPRVRSVAHSHRQPLVTHRTTGSFSGFRRLFALACVETGNRRFASVRPGGICLARAPRRLPMVAPPAGSISGSRSRPASGSPVGCCPGR